VRKVTYNFYIDPKHDEFDRMEEIKCHWRKYSDYKIEVAFMNEQSWELRNIKFIAEIQSTVPIFDSKLRIINNIKLHII